MEVTADQLLSKARDEAKAFMTERLLVSAKDAARMMGISTRTLWTLTNMETIACVRIGRSVRYSPDDLKAFIDIAKTENRTSRVFGKRGV